MAKESEGKGDAKSGAEEAAEKKPGRGFIKNAIKRPGAMTAKAKTAGMSSLAYARANQHAGGVNGDEARFYLNFLHKTGPKRG